MEHAPNAVDIHISIHALRKESDLLRPPAVTCRHISIHALRKESDLLAAEPQRVLEISIHALRKESDAWNTHQTPSISIFQSTLSVRRATEVELRNVALDDISIHALRKESDRAAGHFCPLSETQASCLALSISNNTTGTTNNMPKTSSCLSVSF